MQFAGYQSRFSAPSPYLRKGRNYQLPNDYRQVGIYSRVAIREVPISECLNTLCCEIGDTQPVRVLAGVMTIKDRWASWSKKVYTNRVKEQVEEIKLLSTSHFIACGDYNCRAGTTYNKSGYTAVAETADELNLSWATRTEDRTVQQILYSSDLTVTYNLELAGDMSDHPLLLTNVQI